MAVVQIPIGGRMVGIDIPPLDINDMGQLLAYTVDQNNILSSIAGALGSQTQAINQLSGKLPSGSGSGGSGSDGNDGINRTNYSSKISSGISSVANALTSGGTKLSTTINDLLSSLNLGALGAGVGSYFSILEEYGSSMQQLNRVGAGVGQNFIELRNDAAKLGLSLSDISKLTKESGVTVGSLGRNSAEGVTRLMKFTAELRKSTEAAGYYGMGSAELAQYMTDELEIRRQQSDSAGLRTLNETALAKAMNENLAAQQAMAAITGQDVYDRIKAQQEARRDAQVQAFMTAEQQAAFSIVNGEMTALGKTAQGLFGQGLKFTTRGLQAPDELQALFQAAETAGVPLREKFDELTNAVNNNLPTQDLVTNLGNILKNMDIGESQGDIALLAPTGRYGESTNILAQIRSETIGTGTTGEAEARAQRESSQATYSAAKDSGEMSFLGTTAELEVAMAKTKALMSEAVLIAAGVDVDNLKVAQQGFSNITKTLRDMPDTEPFKAMMNSLAYVMIVGSGARAVINPFSGEGAEQARRAVVDANNLALAGAKAFGLDNGYTQSMEAVRLTDYAFQAGQGLLKMDGVQSALTSTLEALKDPFAGAGNSAMTFSQSVVLALKYMGTLVPGVSALLSTPSSRPDGGGAN